MLPNAWCMHNASNLRGVLCKVWHMKNSVAGGGQNLDLIHIQVPSRPSRNYRATTDADLQMAPKRIGTFAQAWYKWKTLRLPWRKRFLMGKSLPQPAIAAVRPVDLHGSRSQAMTSRATPTGSSASRAAPKAASAGDASSTTPDRRTTPRSRSTRSGTSGCGTPARNPRPSTSNKTTWCARRGSRCWPPRPMRAGSPSRE